MFQFSIRDFKAALIELTFGIIHPKRETNIIANQQKLYNIALKEVLIIKKVFTNFDLCASNKTVCQKDDFFFPLTAMFIVLKIPATFAFIINVLEEKHFFFK